MKKAKWLTGAAALAVLLTVGARAAGDKVTYLGVATEPLDPTIAYHLNIPEGMGLVVVHVDEQGVVAGQVRERDILQKFDDQLLTSQEQLAVLVRSRKPGDSVSLSVLRKGKAEELKVKLGETDAANVRPPPGFRGGAEPQPFGGRWDGNMESLRQQMEGLHKRWQGGAGDDAEAEREEPPRPVRPRKPMPLNQQPKVAAESHATSVVTQTENGFTITVKTEDGKKTVRAEENGKVLFDGPADTDDQVKKMPDKVRERYGDMKSQVKIHVETGGTAPRPGAL